MFAITGITGRVGGAVARHLIADGHKVSAVVRSEHNAQSWAALGCDVAMASIDDGTALARAFTGTQGVFLMSPPNYDPAPGFPDTVHAVTQIRHAIESAAPVRVVLLSTVGAHVNEPNLLNNALIMEQMLRSASVPVALLRAAWFMENAAGDVDSAARGVIHSFLQPLDHAIPMVATADISRTAAELLPQAWTVI